MLDEVIYQDHENRRGEASEDAEGETAASRAYHALERMIVMLDLPPSGTTTERALIDRLGLGRTPVREAIQRLSWEGLIDVRPRAGLVIAPLRASDWPLVVAAREGVEIVLARSAARHASEAMAARLATASDAMDRAIGHDDVGSFLEADKLLDEAVAEAADNPYAVRVAGPLQTHSRRFWFRYQSRTGLARSAGRHMRLIAAILDRDEEAAAREAGLLMTMLRELAEAASR